MLERKLVVKGKVHEATLANVTVLIESRNDGGVWRSGLCSSELEVLGIGMPAASIVLPTPSGAELLGRDVEVELVVRVK